MANVTRGCTQNAAGFRRGGAGTTQLVGKPIAATAVGTGGDASSRRGQSLGAGRKWEWEWWLAPKPTMSRESSGRGNSGKGNITKWIT